MTEEHQRKENQPKIGEGKRRDGTRKLRRGGERTSASRTVTAVVRVRAGEVGFADGGIVDGIERSVRRPRTATGLVTATTRGSRALETVRLKLFAFEVLEAAGDRVKKTPARMVVVFAIERAKWVVLAN